jgi:hypothetical protein
MAQENTRQRLMAFFGDAASFEIADKENSYELCMIFPVLP